MAIAYAMDDLDMYLPSNVARCIKILKEPDYSGEVTTRDEEVALLKHAAASRFKKFMMQGLIINC
jgi:hypothetical protein